MNELELEIFEQASDYSELRLRGGGGLRTRGLDRTAIDQLIAVVELDRRVSHPDQQPDTEMLHRVRQELASSDPAAGRDDVGGR